MVAGNHSTLTTNHSVCSGLSYETQALRIAANGMLSTDIGKIALVADGTRWIVRAVAAGVPSWEQIVCDPDCGTGDGETDDTAAIKAAIERSHGLPNGALSDSGQGDTLSTSSRAHRATRLQPLTYRLTSPITIRFHRISIVGGDSAADGAGGTEEATIVVDHDGPAFIVDATTYAPSYFSMRGLRITRAAGQARSGPAILIRGGWVNGIALAGCYLDNHDVAIEVDSDNYDEPSVCRLQLANCFVTACNWAIRTHGRHLTLHSIRDSSLTANLTGAIECGLASGTWDNVDLEATTAASIVLDGSNSHDFEIRNLFFEGNQGEALLDLTSASKCYIGPFHVHGSISAMPLRVSGGYRLNAADHRATLIATYNAVVRTIELTDSVSDTLADGCWDARSASLGRQNALADTAQSFVDGNWTESRAFGDVTLAAREIGTVGSPAAYANITITQAVASGQNALIAFAVVYDTGATIQPYHTVAVTPHADGGSWLNSESVTVYVNSDPQRSLNHYCVQHIMMIKASAAWDQIRVTVYPYGGGSDTSYGALVSPIVIAAVPRTRALALFHVPTLAAAL